MGVTRKLVVEFTKMTGAGNDFIVIDNRFYRFDQKALSRLTAFMCPRRTAVGADGLLAIRTGVGDAAVEMAYFNADGSEAPMCGNGARCVARFARDTGLADGELFGVKTKAGIFRAGVPEAGPVTLFFDGLTVVPRGVTSAGVAEDAYYAWTSTDHVVVFVTDVAGVDIEGRGREIRHHLEFAPAGTNVNFAQVLDADNGDIRIRTFERGVEGETLACGTGAMACAITARITSRLRTEAVRVQMPGGSVVIRFDILAEGGATNMRLEGPAEYVYRGSVELEPGELFRA